MFVHSFSLALLDTFPRRPSPTPPYGAQRAHPPMHPDTQHSPLSSPSRLLGVVVGGEPGASDESVFRSHPRAATTFLFFFLRAHTDHLFMFMPCIPYIHTFLPSAPALVLLHASISLSLSALPTVPQCPSPSARRYPTMSRPARTHIDPSPAPRNTSTLSRICTHVKITIVLYNYSTTSFRGFCPQ